MKGLLPKLVYFGRTAWRGLVASPVTSAVAIGTIGISLVLVGAFALTLTNMEELLDRFGDDLRVTAYLTEGLSERERDELAALVKTVEGVESVRWSPRTRPWSASAKASAAARRCSMGSARTRCRPSLEITLVSERRSPAGMAVVVEALTGLEGIDDLASGQDWVEGYLRFVSLVRGLAIGLGLILVLATLLIVANTIRLAVYSRRDELEILSLVGASRPFVSTPFLLEGLLQGGIGGTLALLLLFGLFRLVLPGFEFGLELVLGGAAPRFFSGGEALWLVLGGASLGLMGSTAALAGGWRS